MFDIPEDKKSVREIVRRTLENIGFIKLQKSVYIFPHDCKKEINALAYYCSASRYLKYLVVDIVEGEEEIITQFIDNKIIKLKDLQR